MVAKKDMYKVCTLEICDFYKNKTSYNWDYNINNCGDNFKNYISYRKDFLNEKIKIINKELKKILKNEKNNLNFETCIKCKLEKDYYKNINTKIIIETKDKYYYESNQYKFQINMLIEKIESYIKENFNNNYIYIIQNN